MTPLIRKLLIASLIVPLHCVWNNISMADERDTVVEFIFCQNPPTVVSTPLCHYPEEARNAGIEGKVFVRVLIDEDGTPIRAEVVKRTPGDCTMFDKEATRIAMESKYTPGVQYGKNVRVWITLPVRFSLHKGLGENG
jgi:protein TonB